MTINLRPARPDEADLLLSMIRSLAADTGEAHLVTATVEDVKRDAFGPEPCYEAIIAEDNEAIAGMIIYYVIYSSYRGAPALFVDTVYVDPNARQSGVGRQLLAHACNVALERDYCRVELNVMNDNDATGFYQRIGMAWNGEHVYKIAGENLVKLARV